MADQVPRRSYIMQEAALRFPFLHAVFTEVPYPRIEGRADRSRRMRFGDCNDSDSIGIASNTIRSARNACANAKEIFGDNFRIRLHDGDFSMAPLRPLLDANGATVFPRLRRARFSR
jgi:hypothetical protein